MNKIEAPLSGRCSAKTPVKNAFAPLARRLAKIEVGKTRELGFEENSYWRHYEAVYAMYGRLRKRFPHLMMENCAGGGGRNDLGMLQNFNWAQVSDEWGAVRTLKIINGFMLALPPEYALSYVGFMSSENYRYGDTDFRLRGQVFGHLCLGGIAPDLKSFPANYRARVKHDVDLYKTFIRPILPSTLVTTVSFR